MTTRAGSGHATSSLSAVELCATLFFNGHFRYDSARPGNPHNDRIIFSKGHASPLFYALWAAAGAVRPSELLKLRTFNSPLEGHPTMRFKFSEAATGSLGQGLSVGVGMALNAKYLDKLSYRTWVLLGDSEMAEGQVWEAMQIAAHYKLNNLVAIVDVNGLGQRGATMTGHAVETYARRAVSFGWETLVVNGHSVSEVNQAYRKAMISKAKPVMILAKTVKGKGVSFLENKNGWHGKALSARELTIALRELGSVAMDLRGKIISPRIQRTLNPQTIASAIKKQAQAELRALLTSTGGVATRMAYGAALTYEMARDPHIVALDAEVSNSTYAEVARAAFPQRFFEMYIAEQNMVGVALGFSRRGKKPFVSTFAAFLTRAFDQIRMAAYSGANIAFVGSHAGVSIGEDGPSQMGLEDIALFRSTYKSVVLYPCDAVSTAALVSKAARYNGISYIRTTRHATPLLYKKNVAFPIGGSKTLRRSARDVATIIAAGITVFEALKAYEELKKNGVMVRVIDLYSIKPLDAKTVQRAARETKRIITVEDHIPAGGLGEAVAAALLGIRASVTMLAVKKMPRSGTPLELLDYEEISAKAISRAILKPLQR